MPGLSDHVVLAVLHHPNAERRPLVGDAGAHHQLNRLVLEDLVLAARHFGLGESLDECCGEVGLFRVHRHQLSAAADDRGGLAVDVAVVDADDREANLRGAFRSCRRGLTTDFGPQPAASPFRQERLATHRRDHRRRSRDLFEELSSANARCLHLRVLMFGAKMPNAKNAKIAKSAEI